MYISGAIARKSTPEERDELVANIIEAIPGSIAFRKRLIPGIYASASFDWIIVVNLTASAITIGSALWMAYQKMAKNSSKSERVIFQIKYDANHSEQIIIDSNSSKDIIIETINLYIEEKNIDTNRQEHINNLIASGNWVRVNIESKNEC